MVRRLNNSDMRRNCFFETVPLCIIFSIPWITGISIILDSGIFSMVICTFLQVEALAIATDVDSSEMLITGSSGRMSIIFVLVKNIFRQEYYATI